MLDLAISMDHSPQAVIVETNHGVTLGMSEWPQDCDFQLVAFDPSRTRCEVVWCDDLASDIRAALKALVTRVEVLMGPVR